jgi:hypothetical protein
MPLGHTPLVLKRLETLCDCSNIGLAVSDEVTRKGKMFDWNRIVTIARRSIGEHVGIP